MRRVPTLDRNQNESRPKLWDAMLAGVEDLPVSLVAKVLKLIDHDLAVARELALGEPLDVLQHDSGWPSFAHESHRFREQIPLVGSAELATRHRERRGRGAAPHPIAGRVP